MKTRVPEARRTAAAATLIAGLAVTGCSAINYPATTHVYSASDGAMAEIEGVDLRHIMFVAEEENSPARMIGMINNGSGVDAEVEVAVAGGSFTVQVEPGEAVNLEHDEELIVDSIEAAPGSMQEVTVSVSSETGSGEETFDATVLDGALQQYRDLLPGEFDTSTIEHLEHGPDTWGGGAAHYDPEDAEN